MIEAVLLGAASIEAGALAVVSAVATHRARALRRSLDRQLPPARGQAPRVLMLRPCAGEEPFLGETLGSLVSARWPGSLSLVMTVADSADPARPRVESVAAELQRAGVDVRTRVVRPNGPNHKVAQLAGVADPLLSRFDVVIVVDSDVDLTGFDFGPLVAAVTGDPEGRMGAAFCPPVERDARTQGDRISAAVLQASLHGFGLLGALDPRGFVGKTFAVATPALARIGGFASLVRCLGEDMELARRLRAQGLVTRMVPTPVSSRASGRTVAQVVARYARWVMVIRAQRPALLPSYPLLFGAAPLALALALGAAAEAPAVALSVCAATLIIRLAVVRAAARTSGQPGKWAPGLAYGLLADLVLLAAFFRALGPATVRWRGRVLRLGPNGRLLEPSRPPVSDGTPASGDARPGAFPPPRRRGRGLRGGPCSTPPPRPGGR